MHELAHRLVEFIVEPVGRGEPQRDVLEEGDAEHEVAEQGRRHPRLLLALVLLVFDVLSFLTAQGPVLVALVHSIARVGAIPLTLGFLRDVPRLAGVRPRGGMHRLGHT